MSSSSDSYSPAPAADPESATPRDGDKEVEQACDRMKKRKEGSRYEGRGGMLDAMVDRGFLDPRYARRFGPQDGRESSSMPTRDLADERQVGRFVARDDGQSSSMASRDFENARHAGQFVPRNSKQHNSMPSHHNPGSRQTHHSDAQIAGNSNSMPPQHFGNSQQASHFEHHQQSSSSHNQPPPPTYEFPTRMHMLAWTLNTKAGNHLREMLIPDHQPLSPLHIRVIIWLLDPALWRSNADNTNDASFIIKDIDDCFKFILEQFWNLGRRFLVELCEEGLEWKDRGFEVKEGMSLGVRWNDIERMERQVAKMEHESRKLKEEGARRNKRLGAVEKGWDTVADRRDWFRFDKDVVEKLKEWKGKL